MARTNQTKQLLAKALQELLETTPLEKISVNDIVEQAQVGRNTFYYHFVDKYDLVNWYFQTGVTQFLLTRAQFNTWKHLLICLEEYFRENKTFYTKALEYNGQNSLQEYIFHYMGAIFEERLSGARPGMKKDELDFVSNFLAGALMGVILTWVKDGMQGEIKEHYTALQELCNGDLIRFLLLNDPDLPPDLLK